MSDYVIRAENLGKCYRIQKLKKNRMLRDVVSEAATQSIDFVKSLGKQRNKLASAEQEVWALKDVSFTIKAGESFGIIGSNGAGKSTLLKVLALITAPSTGKVRIRGRMGSLLEVGTGFHSELTGRENIYLNGAILGMRRVEINRKFDEIVAFSEIKDYLDTPVKHYSSGMRMRLAFSVAAHLEPEILLIDEVLAVGDLAFQRKSINKMNAVVVDGRTVLFVSHNMAAVRALCQKAIFIDNGMIQMIGDVDPVIQQYLNANEGRLKNSPEFVEEDITGTKIISATVMDSEKMPSVYLAHDKPAYVRLTLQISHPMFNTYVNIKIYNQDLDMILVSYDFEDDESRLELRKPGRYTYDIQLPENILPPGKYFLGFEISRLKRNLNKERMEIFHQVDHVSPFEVFDNGSVLSKVSLSWKGTVHPPIHWELLPGDGEFDAE
jgi:lipopolysaccharide transport system ATP-binding protein